MPKVSVILPFHNPGRLLWRAVRSVVAQSLRDWELVAVDDGSTDGSENIVRRWAGRDARVRLRSPGRVGLIEALNHGIDASVGEYLARMDADDLMHRDRLRLQVELFESDPSLDIAACLVESFPRSDILEGMARYQEWLNSLVRCDDIRRDMFVESPFAHPSVMLRRSPLASRW